MVEAVSMLFLGFEKFGAERIGHADHASKNCFELDTSGACIPLPEFPQ